MSFINCIFCSSIYVIVTLFISNIFSLYADIDFKVSTAYTIGLEMIIIFIATMIYICTSK